MGEPCVPTESKVDFEDEKVKITTKEEVREMGVKPLMQAPDFETQGYLNGEFKPFKLSDFKGKWVILCFYPADFTFV